MPLWLVFHPPGTFEEEETKQAFAKSVTSFYTAGGLPAFYVVVNFIKLDPSNTWVGGDAVNKGPKPFIRIAVEHIAVRMPNSDEVYKSATDRLDALMKPHIQDKGYNWEYHIDETERRLWKINGLAPPPWKSEGEKVWFRENRAVPPEEMPHKEAARL